MGTHSFQEGSAAFFFKKLEVESFGKSAEVYLARRTGKTGMEMSLSRQVRDHGTKEKARGRPVEL